MAIATALAGRPVSNPIDEASLVGRLGRGDPDAAARLYGRYGRPLYSYVVDLVADAGLAEEIVQDTFVAAWRGAHGFEGRSSVASWLFGIARRQARDRLRRTRPATIEAAVLESRPDETSGPETLALASASRAELAAALDRLPAHQREPLVLAFVHDMSGSEIAAVLGVPEGTVKSRLFAARRALRVALGEAEEVR